MARKAIKRTRRKARKVAPARKEQKGFFSRIRFAESYTSLIVGAIVVLVIGIVFVAFAKHNANPQTSSTNNFLKIEQKDLEKPQSASSTYTIKPGDDLWTISEKVYNNGYEWVELAKVNHLENPGLIHAGNKLVIPTAEPENPIAVNTNPSPTITTATRSTIVTGSIIGATYVIQSGDNLWDICVRAYGDGYKWPEVAQANHLENPDLIFSGNTLSLPR